MKMRSIAAASSLIALTGCGVNCDNPGLSMKILELVKDNFLIIGRRDENSLRSVDNPSVMMSYLVNGKRTVAFSMNAVMKIEETPEKALVCRAIIDAKTNSLEPKRELIGKYEIRYTITPILNSTDQYHIEIK